jgi:hypothetical protein
LTRLIFFALALLVSAAASRADNKFDQAVTMCSGQPWIDVRCNGAVGDGSADDTAAINATVSTAITNNWPVHIPAGTYKVTSKLTWDYQGIAGNGLSIISRGATIDGRTIASGNVLQIICSGGTTGSPAQCSHFRIEGELTVAGSTPAYVVAIGKADFSDQHNAADIEHLVVRNDSTNAAAGGVQLNFVAGGSSLWVSGKTAGGSASTGGVALEKAQMNSISGFASAAGASAPALLIENGQTIGNGFSGFAFDPASAVCISITSANSLRNAWIAPYFACTTAISAPAAAAKNTLIGPTFASASMGPTSQGVSIVGRGALGRYSEPTASSFTAAGADDSRIVSSKNATGSVVTYNGTLSSAASLPVTLPLPADVGEGWTMGFVTDANKAVVITAPSGSKILAGGLQLTTLTLGPGDFEVGVLKSDGTNYRAEYLTTNSRQLNGIDSAHYPSKWTFVSGPGYGVSQGDNGNIISSKLVGGTLTVTLPLIANIQPGWAIAVSGDTLNPIVLQTGGAGGGTILMSDGSSVTTYTFTSAAVESFTFDGVAFRQVTSSGHVIGQIGRFSDQLTGALTADHATFSSTTDSSGPTAQQIFNQATGSADGTTFQSVDGVRGVGIANPSSTVNTVTGVAGYTMNQTVPTGQRSQTSAVFGESVCAVNSSQCWGIATITSDNPTLGNTGTSSGTGKFLFNEFDLYVSSPNTKGGAIVAGGTALPTNTTLDINGISVNKLWGSGGQGTGSALFSNGFIAADACCATGLTVGATGTSGANIPSMNIAFNWFDGSSAIQNTQLQVLGGILFVNGTGNYGIQTVSSNHSVNAFTAGAQATAGINVASQFSVWSYFDATGTLRDYGIQADSNGRMVLLASPGSPNPQFDIEGGLQIRGVPGVTCSGSPSVSFATSNGVVTHC